MASRDGGPIVVGYDGSEYSERALQWAVDEARRTACPVQLIHVVPAPAGRIGQIEAGRRLTERAVEDIALRWPDLPVTAEVIAGEPSTVLAERSAGASKIVVGPRGYGAATSALVGSVSLAVAARASCPVIVVRRLPEEVLALPVVAAFDEGARASVAVERAMAEAEARSVSIVVLHMWRPAGSDQYAGGHPHTEQIAETETPERRLLEQFVEPIAARHPEVDMRIRLATGPAGVEQAADQAQLVVVGNRVSGPSGLVLGPVGTHLLRHAPCPVMVIREVRGAGGEPAR